MRKFYFCILTALWIFSCHATLAQVNSMQEVYEYFKDADGKTLAIFDVDMVLVQPSDPAFQMANMKKYSAICKRVLKTVPIEKQMLFLSLMSVSSTPVLIDKSTPEILKLIMQKSPTMALTANLTGAFAAIPSMEQWRINNLRAQKIDFALSAPYQLPFVFDELASYRGEYSHYVEGILFVNGSLVSKGEAFLAFLKRTSLSFEKIIFIDDREDNLKSLEAAIQKLDKPIEYRALHYIGAQKYPSKSISEEEFETRWQELATAARELN